MKNSILAFFFVISGFWASAQQSANIGTLQRYTLSSFQVNFSTSFGIGETYGLGTFKGLAPNAPLLQLDLDGYNRTNYPATSTGFLFSVGFKDSRSKLRNERLEPEWILSFGHLNIHSASLQFYRSESAPYDTITFSSDETQQVLDSTFNQRFSADLYYESVRTELGLILKSKSPSRIRGYFGFLAGFGFNLNYRMSLNYEASTHYDQFNAWSSNTSQSSSTGVDYEGKTGGFNSQIGFPFGILVRFSKTHEMWSRVAFNTEIRPVLYGYSTTLLGFQFDSGAFLNFGINATF